MLRNLFLSSLIFLSSLGSAHENAIIVCENSLELVDFDLAFINGATSSIEINVCYGGGAVFRTLLQAIEDRIEDVPDLQVHMLGSPSLQEKDDRALLAHMQERFPSNFHFQPTALVTAALPDPTQFDNHAKCLIVDEKYFAVGGANRNDALCSDGSFTPKRKATQEILFAMMPSGARDMDVVGRGDVAKELREYFFKTFALWQTYWENGCNLSEIDPDAFAGNNFYTPAEESTLFVEAFENHSKLRKPTSIEFVHSGPMHTPNRITETYTTLIQEASKDILLGQLYFSPPEKIQSELIQGAQRGVSTTIITNGVRDGSPIYNAFFGWANRISYLPLLYGREFKSHEACKLSDYHLLDTSIYEYGVKHVLYHKKVMVVDNQTTVIGSYNLGFRSDASDYEIVLVIDSREVAFDARAVLERDLSLSNKVTPEEACEWYFDTEYNLAGSMQRYYMSI